VETWPDSPYKTATVAGIQHKLAAIEYAEAQRHGISGDWKPVKRAAKKGIGVSVLRMTRRLFAQIGGAESAKKEKQRGAANADLEQAVVSSRSRPRFVTWLGPESCERAGISGREHHRDRAGGRRRATRGARFFPKTPGCRIFHEIMFRHQSLFHMLDQASLKLLLRERAELSAAMFLIGKHIKQKLAKDPAPALPPVAREGAPSGAIPIRALAASTHS